MADTKDFVFPVAGKKIPGYTVSNSSDGSSSWFAGKPSDALYGAQATFRSYKLPDGKWTWREAAPGAINSFAQTNKVTPKQINAVLYDKNSTVPSALNEQRLAQLGKENATKLGVPGATNVAPAAGGDTGGGAAGSGEANKETETQDTFLKQVVGLDSDRKDYGDYAYPSAIRKTKQDCIKFEMCKYTPKKYNNQATSKTGNGSMEVFTGSLTSKEIKGTVILPIQSPISDSNTVSWGEDRLNAFEAGFAGMALQLISGDGGMSVNKGVDIAKGSVGEIKSLVGVNLAERAAKGQSGNLFTRLTGAIINPNMELLFNGPELRTFSFSFVMSARDDKEAKEIRSIIRFFKQGMAVKRAQSNLFLLTPNVFEISYLYRQNTADQKHPWMNRIKTCALQNCAINYTPSGNYATYEDGSMTSYEMTLSFGELTPIYNDDYDDKDSASLPLGY